MISRFLHSPKVNENYLRLHPTTRFFIGLGLLLTQFLACGSPNENTDNNIDPEAQKIALQNEPMVKTACSGCHADVDGDGDQDLVFGNLSMGPESFMSQEQVKKFAAGPACIFLKNTTK